MQNRVTKDSHPNRVMLMIERVDRRIWPIVVSVVYVGLALAYFFRWAPVVQHVPSLWIGSGDLAHTYRAAAALAHGHFGAIYQPGGGFLAYPGILIALAPLGALSNTLHGSLVVIGVNHHLVAHPQVLFTGPPSTFSYLGPSREVERSYFTRRRSRLLPLRPWCCRARPSLPAMRLLNDFRSRGSRRAALGVAEAVVLWPVVVFFGHPEDAVAVALAIYALLFAMDERFTGTGWLFGAALAVQPLVLMMFPILLVIGGKRRALGLVVRGVVPAAAVTVAPLAAGFHDTVHTLLTQPAFPYPNVYQTPWTFLAPKLGGTGANTSVGGGPMRLAVLALAAGVGWRPSGGGSGRR